MNSTSISHGRITDTWYGGVVRARSYDREGRHRPDIAAWITDTGRLLSARAVPPGESVRALCDLLATARSAARSAPKQLIVEQPNLVEQLRPHCDLPLRQGMHWGFSLVLEDNLRAIPGLGYEQGYVDRDVSVQLARELCDASRAFLALDVVHVDRPHLCALSLERVGRFSVWIGHEPSVLGNGIRLFRDLDAYRDYMHVNVAYDRVWSASDDASVLGLAAEHVRRLNPKQRSDIERHRLVLQPPGFAPIVIATDTDDVDRPYDAADVQTVVLATRALCGAFAHGQLEYAGDVQLFDQTFRTVVRLRHPDATAADMALTCIPDSDFADDALL